MIEVASIIQTFCVAAKAVKKTGEKVTEVIDTYNSVREALIEKDKTLEPIVQDIENEPDDKAIQRYFEKKLQASPAIESPEVQTQLKQLTEVVKESKSQPSSSQSASNVQGKVIQIKSGDNATFGNIG